MKFQFPNLFGKRKKPIAKPPKEFSKDYVLWVVEKANVCKDVTPGEPLVKVALEIHLYPQALQRVGCYGRLSDGYVMAMTQKYGKNLPYDVEKAIIELERTNLIYIFTRAGINWSEQAKKLMKKEHPTAYKHNVLDKK
ncbi:MAG: hypothetical protein J6W96_00560 [Alphaproteobacteria bacterium]|nr:hypothetical protein [Alphaproteobacteria bacterium]